MPEIQGNQWEDAELHVDLDQIAHVTCKPSTCGVKIRVKSEELSQRALYSLILILLQTQISPCGTWLLCLPLLCSTWLFFLPSPLLAAVARLCRATAAIGEVGNITQLQADSRVSPDSCCDL